MSSWTSFNNNTQNSAHICTFEYSSVSLTFLFDFGFHLLFLSVFFIVVFVINASLSWVHNLILLFIYCIHISNIILLSWMQHYFLYSFVYVIIVSYWLYIVCNWFFTWIFCYFYMFLHKFIIIIYIFKYVFVCTDIYIYI